MSSASIGNAAISTAATRRAKASDAVVVNRDTDSRNNPFAVGSASPKPRRDERTSRVIRNVERTFAGWRGRWERSHSFADQTSPVSDRLGRECVLCGAKVGSEPPFGVHEERFKILEESVNSRSQCLQALDPCGTFQQRSLQGVDLLGDDSEQISANTLPRTPRAPLQIKASQLP
jgi:hypothetical protein